MPDSANFASLCSKLPINGVVVVVEDESKYLDELSIAILEMGYDCRKCRSRSAFNRLCTDSSVLFDSASIDWQLGVNWCGDLMVAEMRNAGRKLETCMTFTKHSGVEQLAIKAGVDIHVNKRAGRDISHFKSSIVALICLAIGRRILLEVNQRSLCASAFDESSGSNQGLLALPDVNWSGFFDGRTEVELCKNSRSFAFREFRAFGNWVDAKQSSLLQLLRRRNWWRSFESNSFVKSPTGEKLRQLCDFAHVSISQLSIATEIPEHTLRPIVENQGSLLNLASDAKGRLISVLSLLDRLLCLCLYEPEYMSAICLSPEAIPTRTAPPWSGRTLGDFLSTTKSSGVISSLEWCYSGGFCEV